MQNLGLNHIIFWGNVITELKFEHPQSHLSKIAAFFWNSVGNLFAVVVKKFKLFACFY